jgi:hypothetical protein
MTTDISHLVNLAALHHCGRAGKVFDGQLECLAAIEYVQPRNFKIHAAGLQISKEFFDHRAVFSAALTQSQEHLSAVQRNAHRYDEMFGLEFGAVYQQGAELQCLQRPLQNLLQLLSTTTDKVIADGRLLHAVIFRELLQQLTVPARRNLPHHAVPHRVFHQSGALEQFVTAQWQLTILAVSYTRPTHAYLLALHYAVAPFGAPAIGLAIRLWLIAFADQKPNFLFHRFLHGFAQQRSQKLFDSLLQLPDHVGERKHHLDRRVLFVGTLLEFLQRALSIDLVSSFQTDSPFLFPWPEAYHGSGPESPSKFQRSSGQSRLGVVGNSVFGMSHGKRLKISWLG